MTNNIIPLARYRHARYPDASRGGNCFSAAVIAAIPTLILICWWMT